MHDYNAILEDTAGASENAKVLIARARSILAIRRANTNGDIPSELVVEHIDAKITLQEHVPLSQELRDKLKTLI